MKDLHSWQLKFNLCYYSRKLINKIMFLNKRTHNKVNVTEIKKAIYYAKKYHADQKRETGEPYYAHPLSVAEMVVDFCFEVNAIVAAILHDVVEDTPLKIEHISNIFNHRVAEIVKRLTRVTLPKLSCRISSEELLIQSYMLNDAVVILIKLLDRLHNLQTIYIKNQQKQKQNLLEVLNTFYLLSFKLDQNIVNKFEQYLKNSTLKQDHLIFSYGTFQLDFPEFQNNF
jgi:guanosine-3',5'-bis(diphosphate) 3'-pyrophosphohydrolase